MLKLTDPRRVKVAWQKIETKLRGYMRLRKEFRKFKKMSEKVGNRFPVVWDDVFFLPNDATATTGFNVQYVYHPAWAARVLSRTRPAKHVDIASHVSFISLVSAFVPIEFYDYRPANIMLTGLTTKRGDLMALPFPDNSVQSLSCMHTVEHIGLGRYGDPLDPDGDLKAIRELQRVTAHGGDFLFAVPMGKAKLHFNSDRTYSYDQITEYFKDFEVKEFFLIPDDPQALSTGCIMNATKADADAQVQGCGCFWFRKK